MPGFVIDAHGLHNSFLVPESQCLYTWLFQLDDEPNLYEWVVRGCFGYQVCEFIVYQDYGNDFRSSPNLTPMSKKMQEI